MPDWSSRLPTPANSFKEYEWGDAACVLFAAFGAVDYAAGPEAVAVCDVHLTQPSLEAISQAFTEVRSSLLPASDRGLERPVIDPSVPERANTWRSSWGKEAGSNGIATASTRHR